MTRYIAFVVLMLASLLAAAQSRISVKEETYDDMETTAMVNPEKDRNNRDCALVIFHNVEPNGYYFDAGSVFIKAENHVSRDSGDKTIFLHISEGAKLINILHRNDGIMSLRYEFANGPLQARHTYHVYLGSVVPANANAKQYLRFKITPPTATLEVEEEPGQYIPWLVDPTTGKASKKLPLGEYSYRVQARLHHSTAGKAVMTDVSQACDETVALTPAYGTLAIAPIEGAQVFVDSENRPNYSNIHLDAGQHSVTIQRPKYKTFRTTVTIVEGQTTRLSPDFEANFGTVRLQASAPDVTIALRDGAGADRILGTGSWNGDLDAESYTVVSSALGHRESVYTITVPAGAQDLTFTLPAPTPIYGSLDISSTPDGASIKIDGTPAGQTPLQLNNVLIGEHTVAVSIPDKEPFVQTVDVAEGASHEIFADMSKQGDEKLHKVDNFYDLPDFIVHPLGYDGPWDFNDRKKTQKELIKYFKGLDKSFYIVKDKVDGSCEVRDKSKHYQKIGKYNYQFRSMNYNQYIAEDDIDIIYELKPPKFDESWEYLKELNPTEARLSEMNNGIIKHVTNEVVIVEIGMIPLGGSVIRVAYRFKKEPKISKSEFPAKKEPFKAAERTMPRNRDSTSRL